MALDIVAILTAAEGKEKAVEELLINLANGVKDGEPKVTRYKPYSRIGEDGSSEFVVIERYPDEAGLEAHQATEHYQAAIKKAGGEGLLAGPMTVMKLKALDGGFDTR